MRLTGEDREFLERLAPLLRSGLVKVCQDRVPPHAFALTCPSWSEAEREMRTSRLAIRRRAWRLFNQLYVPACETVMLIEQHLGPEYGRAAIASARDHGVPVLTAPIDASFQSADAFLPGEATLLLCPRD